MVLVSRTTSDSRTLNPAPTAWLDGGRPQCIGLLLVVALAIEKRDILVGIGVIAVQPGCNGPTIRSGQTMRG